jgi:hypothetical protein
MGYIADLINKNYVTYGDECCPEGTVFFIEYLKRLGSQQRI